jgi:hypothetical protein
MEVTYLWPPWLTEGDHPRFAADRELIVQSKQARARRDAAAQQSTTKFTR